MSIPEAARAQAAALLRFIDASPSPWHAAGNLAARFAAAGFAVLDEGDAWQLAPGGRYLVRRGASLIAFVGGRGSPAEHGLRLAGAHTDSPGLRVKPRPTHVADGMLRLAVEVYGGPILATFADRDLSLAGRVMLRGQDGGAPKECLVHFDKPIARLPNLAIHMNREVNEAGLKFHKQNELPLILSVAPTEGDPGQVLHAMLAACLGVAAGEILSWDLAVCDTQPGACWGPDEEFLAASRLDNLASCDAIAVALEACGEPQAGCVAAFFDHEEVGSESAAGAAGSFVADVLRRYSLALGADEEGHRRMLAKSFMVSADMAHAWHPNFPAAYEPGHRVLVNAGPVIKHNANQRYSTDADTAARFMTLCAEAGVPCQQYAHRTDLGCGSTIGPVVAARLGVPSVDVGAPMWAMHSLRESAGVADHAAMIAALGRHFG